MKGVVEVRALNLNLSPLPVICGKIGLFYILMKTKGMKGLTMEEFEEQKQRIADTLGVENLAVTLKSLTLYREYLRRNLDMPCTMTGIEGFPWEEKYVLGFDEKTEHETLKEKQPSCTDIYELKRFEDLMDETTGIIVKVKRIKDNRRFVLELASLKAIDKTSKNYILLDDYSAWFFNH